MPKWDTPLEWFKIHTTGWLFGSIRDHLTLEEQGFWVNFLALAALHGGGFVPKQPYEELGRKLKLTYEQVDRCLNKLIVECQVEAKDDIWVIKNWDEYQSAGGKSLKTRKKKSNSDICGDKELDESLKPTVLREEERREEERREENITVQISEFTSTYNAVVKNIGKVEKLSAKRKEKIKSRLKYEPSIEWWTRVFKIADDIDLPANEKYPAGWRPSFDWLIENDTNPTKVAEGRYKQKKQTPKYLQGLKEFYEEGKDERRGIHGDNSETPDGVPKRTG